MSHSPAFASSPSFVYASLPFPSDVDPLPRRYRLLPLEASARLWPLLLLMFSSFLVDESPLAPRLLHLLDPQAVIHSFSLCHWLCSCPLRRNFLPCSATR